ncbi:DUF305 domain-containing protein [Tardiphaga sp.]|jgi:uncharacterized protein (DUF305 family)|uniref:DUF305 domain-containing protein n=1 Tax=Tardiphaga sp. TaxID=1926292 RepID=UPI0037D9EF8B
MTEEARSEWRRDLYPAVVLGLISSSFSTAVSQLAAGRLGRDASVDWMTVASIPFGNDILTAEPTGSAIAAGIAFHQWADFSWALFFFVAMRRWTAPLDAAALAGLTLPWALATSFLEWACLVPLFPFRQPIFPLQQPYWIGFLVHLSSAAIYPLYPALRTWLVHRRSPSGRVSLAIAAAICVLMGLAAADLYARHRGEVRWIGGDSDGEPDRTFLRHMHAHHQQGIQLAGLGIERAQSDHLRQVANLMVASQAGEVRVFERWWRSWFGASIESCGSSERAEMPGYLSDDELAKVAEADDAGFDSAFIEAMTIHHKGAVRMADRQLGEGRDIRLRALAHAIRHEQQGEIALMRGLSGSRAVHAALRFMAADVVN